MREAKYLKRQEKGKAKRNYAARDWSFNYHRSMAQNALFGSERASPSTCCNSNWNSSDFLSLSGEQLDRLIVRKLSPSLSLVHSQ